VFEFAIQPGPLYCNESCGWIPLDIPPEKTSAGLVAWCKENLGAPYWYACFGQAPTAELLAYKANQYPYSKYNPFYGPTDMQRYRAHIGKYNQSR